jgi:hypothetical protein
MGAMKTRPSALRAFLQGKFRRFCIGSELNFIIETLRQSAYLPGSDDGDNNKGRCQIG